MQIEMKATPDIVCIDGVYCRIWEGVTARGVLCKVFVHRVAVDQACDSAEFDQELRACLPPGREIDLDRVLQKRRPSPPPPDDARRS